MHFRWEEDRLRRDADPINPRPCMEVAQLNHTSSSIWVMLGGVYIRGIMDGEFVQDAELSEVKEYSIK